MFQSEFNDTSYVILRRDELGAVSYLTEGITYEIQVRLITLIILNTQSCMYVHGPAYYN